MYPADFSENGIMLPHRHPFGLPFTLPKGGVEYAIVVGKAYPLVGGGYMYAKMPNAQGILANEETTATIKPWNFDLGTKHSHGKDEKTLINCTTAPDARFPIDGKTGGGRDRR
jgi:hypothetical protein